jgi:hypothetical protein
MCGINKSVSQDTAFISSECTSLVSRNGTELLMSVLFIWAIDSTSTKFSVNVALVRSASQCFRFPLAKSSHYRDGTVPLGMDRNLLNPSVNPQTRDVPRPELVGLNDIDCDVTLNTSVNPKWRPRGTWIHTCVSTRPTDSMCLSHMLHCAVAVAAATATAALKPIDDKSIRQS